MMQTQLQTPYYVIEKNMLDELLTSLKDSLNRHWSNSIIGYSYKTNALPWVISYFNNRGCFAEVVSDSEYALGGKIGVPKGHFIYNGPIKTKESFLQALHDGAIVNIDSWREIDWLDEIEAEHTTGLGIRVNFDIERLCPGQSQCPRDGGRFGFCFENGELERAIKLIESKNHRIHCLHLHTSSKTRGLDIYQAIAEMACKVVKLYHLELDYLDVGGGFFGGLPTKPQFDDYLSLITGILREEFVPEKTKLILEPGMALIGAPVHYVTSVIDVKDTIYSRFVVTDGSRTSIDPLMTKKSYLHRYVTNQNLEKINKQIICGYTCMENDRLFVAENEQELCVGDRIIYEKVGAYTMCLTPLFIKYFPDVYVADGEMLTKVRYAWTEDEYVQNSIAEE